LGKPLGIDVVAYDRVIQIADPVYLDCARDMPHIVQQYILIRLDNTHIRIAKVFGYPRGAY
jgi:hypothetical protein